MIVATADQFHGQYKFKDVENILYLKISYFYTDNDKLIAFLGSI